MPPGSLTADPEQRAKGRLLAPPSSARRIGSPHEGRDVRPLRDPLAAAVGGALHSAAR